MIKVGMLGAGFILKSHASAVAALEGTSLDTVADLSLSRAKAAAKQYGFAHAVDSIEALAASQCDVVHILLPPALHVPAARQLLEAGKSVFLEKPMGLSVADCENLATLAEQRGLTLGVNHNFLFSRSYSKMRSFIQEGGLGVIDHLSINWHYGLPILQTGPFDNWMVGAPANLIFETGPHLLGFVTDLLRTPEIRHADAANPTSLPGGSTAFRHWEVLGRAGDASVTISMSTVAGQADRYLRVRGSGGSAQVDFGRDFGWVDSTVSDNPFVDSYRSASGAARQLRRTARSDVVRRIKGSLGMRPDVGPFEDSIFRSIAAFYEGGIADVDRRHSAAFAVDVVRSCQAIADKAGVGVPSQSGLSLHAPAPSTAPTVLVVGGSGFIGRRVVEKLASAGVGVRVMTRNARAAAFTFAGVPVDIVEGWHGDAADAAAALSGIDVVVHLAKCEGKRWDDYVRGDIKPTQVLADAALSAGVKRFIYTGTIDSYASASARATIDSSTPVDAKIARRNLYARSKAACEALLQNLHQQHGLPLVILRPGIVIGAGSPPAHLGIGRFTSETQMTFWGDGTSALPLVLVDDVAEAIVLATKVPDIEGKSFLLTSPPLLTARDYVDAFSRSAGLKMAAVPLKAYRYWLGDWVKELAKNAIRHPNRRVPSLHDWDCKSHRARYDSEETCRTLNWRPVADRQTMIARGIEDAVDYARR